MSGSAGIASTIIWETNMEYALVPVGDIYPNPKNPRFVRDAKFQRLVESVRTFPEMLKLRPIIVDGTGMILAGNQRYQAARTIGMSDVPVIRAADLTEAQQRELVIKDNVHAGEFAFSSFFDNHDDWDVYELTSWGLELPFLPNEDPKADRTTVTDRDINAASEKLQDPFSRGTTQKQMTCPNCAHDFYVDG